jgi:TRAP-type C4-dicarboxylate transport system substrate-binding protein
MARSQRRQLGPRRGTKAVTSARRLWPYVLMAWERWQSLSPEQRERYKRQAREYAERGRKALDEQRRRRGSR